MSSEVGQAQYDIFVSYAYDDPSFSGADLGWIQQFISKLGDLYRSTWGMRPSFGISCKFRNLGDK